MRTLALTATLAAALALTGCAAPCDAPTLSVGWTFSDVNGVPGLRCTDVGVAYVDVYVDGARVVDAAACTQYGATIFNLGSGHHDLVVEGLDAGLTIIDRDSFSVGVNGCGDTVVTARPGEGLLRLEYAFDPVNTCAGDFLWYSLLDVTANQLISEISTASTPANQSRFACGGFLEFPVPLGTYRLDWMQAVVFDGGLGRYVAVDQVCSPPQTFDVTAGGLTGVPVTMFPATSDCGGSTAAP